MDAAQALLAVEEAEQSLEDLQDSQLGSKPIVIISRNPSTEEIETSLNSGADSHVTAPFNQRVLLARYRQYSGA